MQLQPAPDQARFDDIADCQVHDPWQSNGRHDMGRVAELSDGDRNWQQGGDDRADTGNEVQQECQQAEQGSHPQTEHPQDQPDQYPRDGGDSRLGRDVLANRRFDLGIDPRRDLAQICGPHEQHDEDRDQQTVR